MSFFGQNNIVYVIKLLFYKQISLNGNFRADTDLTNITNSFLWPVIVL